MGHQSSRALSVCLASAMAVGACTAEITPGEYAELVRTGEPVSSAPAGFAGAAGEAARGPGPRAGRGGGDSGAAPGGGTGGVALTPATGATGAGATGPSGGGSNGGSGGGGGSNGGSGGGGGSNGGSGDGGSGDGGSGDGGSGDGGSGDGFWPGPYEATCDVEDVPSNMLYLNCPRCHQERRYTGTVFDADGQGLRAVEVGVKTPSGLYVACSDRNGHFYFEDWLAIIDWSPPMEVRLRTADGQVTGTGCTPGAFCGECHAQEALDDTSLVAP